MIFFFDDFFFTKDSIQHRSPCKNKIKNGRSKLLPPCGLRRFLQFDRLRRSNPLELRISFFPADAGKNVGLGLIAALLDHTHYDVVLVVRLFFVLRHGCLQLLRVKHGYQLPFADKLANHAMTAVHSPVAEIILLRWCFGLRFFGRCVHGKSPVFDCRFTYLSIIHHTRIYVKCPK